MKRLRSILAALVASLVPAVAFAQDTVADAADTFATIYLLAGGVAVFAIGSLITWGAGKLTGGWLQIAIGQCLTVLDAAIKGTHAEVKRGMEEARDPNSPGGVVITDGEWQGIKDRVWDRLKSHYGSSDAVAKVIGKIIGTKSPAVAIGFIDSKINAGIAELERADKAATRDPSTP